MMGKESEGGEARDRERREWGHRRTERRVGTEYEGKRRNRRGSSSRRIAGNVDSSPHPSSYLERA
jgi:hypothetical protein